MSVVIGKGKTHSMGSIASAISVVMLAVLSVLAGAQTEDKVAGKTSLLIIDVQDFYFPGGFMPLENPEAASLNCKKLLARFRHENGMVVHIGHNTSKDASFHADVTPSDGEQVFHKDEVSAFNGTGLLPYLRENGVERLVISGMMTHMCVEAAVRAAYDLGFECILVSDACATRDLEYGETIISAEDVHKSTLSTLNGSYATVVDTKTYLDKY